MRPCRPEQNSTRSANKFSQQPPLQTRSHPAPPQQVTDTAMPAIAAAEALPPLRVAAAPCTQHCLTLLQAAAARGAPQHMRMQGHPCSAGLSCTLTGTPSLLPPSCFCQLLHSSLLPTAQLQAVTTPPASMSQAPATIVSDSACSCACEHTTTSRYARHAPLILDEHERL
jgi:hypothetical protein